MQAGHQVANTSTTTGFPCSCVRGAPTQFALDAQGFAFDAQGFASTSVPVLPDVLVLAAQGFDQPATAPISNETTASTEKY